MNPSPSSNQLSDSTWIVQSNIKGSPTCMLLNESCGRLGIPFFPISVLRGQKQLPSDLPYSNLIVHGATTLVLLASHDKRFRGGVFFDHSQFTHTSYSEGVGDLYINAEAELMLWPEIEKMISNHGPKFIKPLDDLKAFTGFVANSSSLSKLKNELILQKIETPKGLLLCQPKEVYAEWRLFVVNGRIISGSMYRPWADKDLPEEVIAFGKRAIKQWTPADVFVLDVGKLDQGFKVIECNCFNWSRFYLSRVDLIVNAVTEYQKNTVTS